MRGQTVMRTTKLVILVLVLCLVSGSAIARGSGNAAENAGEGPPSTLMTAEDIIARGPVAIARAKECMNRGSDLTLDEGLKLESESFADLFTTNDQREGTTAFLEKRKPVFRGE